MPPTNSLPLILSQLTISQDEFGAIEVGGGLVDADLGPMLSLSQQDLWTLAHIPSVTQGGSHSACFSDSWALRHSARVRIGFW